MTNKRNISPSMITAAMMIEFVFVVVIVGIVTMLGLNEYSDKREKIQVAAAVAEAASSYRLPISLYYALHGEWPNDWSQVEPFMAGTSARMAAKKNIRLMNGAVSIEMPGTDKNITLHPAVPEEDASGPVKFVTGPISTDPGWRVIGEDHSTLDGNLVWNHLKR
jgi:type II secretory pathway pseudopilin PulG